MDSSMVRRCLFFIIGLFVASAAQAESLDKELLYRLRFGKLDEIAILLDQGADPNTQTKEGVPAATLVLSRTDQEIVPMLRLLVQRGAKVNEGGAMASYPVIEAVRKNNLDAVRFLIEEARADVGVRDNEGYDAAWIARQNGQIQLADYIAKVAEAQRPKRANTPEYRAQLVHKVNFHSCRRQYLNFYYASKQEDVPEAEQKQALEAEGAALKPAMTDLQQLFKLPAEQLVALQSKAGNAIYQELNGLISNRNRASLGVGKPADMDKRCAKIATQLTPKPAAAAPVQK